MQAVVDAARGWIGTPYVHQASVKHAGCDCLGLLRGVWREVKGAEPEAMPAYTMDWGEPQGDEVLLAAAFRHLHLKPLVDEAIGDVILFRMRAASVAKHVGIVSAIGDRPRFIHSYQGHGVIESPLSLPWRRRIAARFTFIEGV